VPPTAIAAVAPISHVYGFGDSMSDNGNAAKLLGADWSAQYYWQGRASNGPTAVEVLAARLNVPLTDYAVYGARSDSDSDSLESDPRLANTGALAQLLSFRQNLKGAGADPKALYFVLIGGTNEFDALGIGQPLDVAALTDQTTDNIVKLVTGLSKTGARHFLVIHVVNLADLPAKITHDRSADAGKIQNAMNAKVSARLTALGAQLKLDIKLFDYLALGARIRATRRAMG
jgi:phospholipase/lecithinase/hemolysin